VQKRALMGRVGVLLLVLSGSSQFGCKDKDAKRPSVAFDMERSEITSFRAKIPVVISHTDRWTATLSREDYPDRIKKEGVGSGEFLLEFEPLARNTAYRVMVEATRDQTMGSAKELHGQDFETKDEEFDPSEQQMSLKLEANTDAKGATATLWQNGVIHSQVVLVCPEKAVAPPLPLPKEKPREEPVSALPDRIKIRISGCCTPGADTPEIVGIPKE